MLIRLKLTLIILLLISSTIKAKAQSINQLDENKGLYGLNFKDSYEKWSSNLDIFIDKDTQKSYFFKSKDILTFHNYPVNRVIVTFYNQKLISIIIDLGIWNAPQNGNYTNISKSLEEYTNLVDVLKSLYGNHTAYDSDLANGKVAMYWEAKTRYLLSKLTYLGVNKGSRVSIEFGDKDQRLQNLKY